MPYIRDYSVFVEISLATAIPSDLPKHEAGDLLLFVLNKDGISGISATPPSGWTLISSFSSAGSGNRCYGKRAASNAETITWALTIAETFIVAKISVAGCYGTTVADAISTQTQASSDTATNPLAGGTITPAHSGCLILSCLGGDNLTGVECLPGWIGFIADDVGISVTNNNALAISYTFQTAASALTHPGYFSTFQDDARWLCLAIRDSGDGYAPGYLDRLVTPAYHISPLSRQSVTAIDGGTWSVSAPVATLNTIHGSMDAIAATSHNLNALQGLNPLRSCMRVAHQQSRTAFSQAMLTFTTPQDLTVGDGFLCGSTRSNGPNDYIKIAQSSVGGILIGVYDAANNYKYYNVLANKAASSDAASQQVYCLDLSNQTHFAMSATPPDLTAITQVAFAACAYQLGISWCWSALFVLGKQIISGGSLLNRLPFNDLVLCVNRGTGGIPLAKVLGGAASFMVPLQIGGGDPVFTGIYNRQIMFPHIANNVDYLDYHVDSSKSGIEFYGQAGDSIHFIGCVFSSPTPYYWRINAASSASCDWSFYGCTISGANVTLQAITLTNMAFNDCLTFAQNGATLNSCFFNNTKITSADISKLPLATFTSGGTGHALEITTPGTYTSTVKAFDGYGLDNTTDAAVYNNSGGHVTINVSGATPTVRNGAGATTTIVAGVMVVIAANISLVDAEVRIYDLDDIPSGSYGTELAGVEYCLTSTFTYSGQAGNVINIQIMQDGYKEYNQQYTIPTTDTTLNIRLVPDTAS